MLQNLPVSHGKFCRNLALRHSMGFAPYREQSYGAEATCSSLTTIDNREKSGVTAY